MNSNWNWGTVSKINVWWKLEQIWKVSVGTETLFFKLFKIKKNNKHWVTTIISYPANSMVALLSLTPLIWKVWPLHQMMMQLNPRQLKEIELKMNVLILWHYSKFSPFLSSGGFISHVPESTLRVSYCVPYTAFITPISTFLLATDCVVPSFCNAANNVTVRHTVTHWNLCMEKITCKLYPYLCNSVKRGHTNCKKKNQNIANLVTKQKFIF